MKKRKTTKRGKRLVSAVCVSSLLIFAMTLYMSNAKLAHDSETRINGSNNGDVSEVEEETPSDKKSDTHVLPEDLAEQPQVSNHSTFNDNKMMTDFSVWNSTCEPTLVVINKANAIPDNYNISLSSYKDKQISSFLKADLEAMVNAAAKDNINIFIYSGYRTIEEQTKYFKAQTEMYKKQGYSERAAQEKAAQSVARPKTSEHNTGLAIDFNCVRDNFYKTKEFAWLINNAHKYGFILRYAKDKMDKTGVIYEPWHFRYVGKEHSRKIMESGLCLEEYVQQYLVK